MSRYGHDRMHTKTHNIDILSKYHMGHHHTPK